MSTLRASFWDNYPLEELNDAEWEALCDGCGRCCLNKLEDIETGQVVLTKVACKLLDDKTCRCRKYQTRHEFVPECISLRPETIAKCAYWLPKTCAYLRLFKGQSLLDWHPLLSGDPMSVHKAGISVQGQTINEEDLEPDHWEDHIWRESHS